MKKRYFVFLFLAVFVLFLSVKAGNIPPARPVVTSVEIMIQQKEGLHHRALTDDKELGMILGYLRAADSPFPVEDLPEESILPFHTIRVHLSDGSSHLYEQMGDEYFRKDGASWKIIDPDQGSKLTKLEKFLFANGL